MMPRLSLTARLTALFSLTSAGVLLGLGLFLFAAIDRHFAVEDYALLGDNLRQLQRVVEDGPAAALPERLSGYHQHHSGLVAQVRTADGRAVYASQDFDFRLALGAADRLAAGEDRFQWEQDGQVFRGIRAVARPAGAQGPVSIMVGIDTEIHAHFMHAFRQSLALYVAVAALASGVLGWWAARRGLFPLRAMAARAMAVTGNRLSERMPVDAVPAEMADLAAKLNAMLERLQDDFGRLSEFSSDLAHELRTPITNLMTQTQVALALPRDAEKYRDVLASNAEELQRLARTVSDMLYLAKMEHGLDLPHPETIRIAEEIHALFEFYDALAEDKAVRLELRGDGRIQGDRLMLRRALSNLLSNALRHTHANATILVDVGASDAGVHIAVENPGPDIRPDQLLAIFDRFFRGDKSRARPESDSVGLGLAITKAIMAAHGGTITARSAQGRTCFTLHFPVR